MDLMKPQRYSVGTGIYSDRYEFYSNEKASERHHQMLLQQLNKALGSKSSGVQTNTYEHLHLIAEKLKRRSLVFLFTDMFQSDKQQHELFEALQHLKYNKHEVVLFYLSEPITEKDLEFDNKPYKFIDLETGEEIKLSPNLFQKKHKEQAENYLKELKLKCLQYKIDLVEIDINKGFDKVLNSYLVKRQKML